MATGFRSIEIRIINHSRGTISVAAYSLMGNGAEWIDGERPQAGDMIEINDSRTYGAYINRNYTVGFSVQFEGIGSVGFRASIDTTNKPTCEPLDVDEGIDANPGSPNRLDSQHVIYDSATILGKATEKRMGLSAEEMQKAESQA